MKKAGRYLYLGLCFLFLYAPIVVLIVFSFNNSKSRSVWSGFTLRWYRDLFHNEFIMKSLLNTLLVAVLASSIATVIGVIASIGISNMKRGAMKGAVMNVTYLPIMNPEIITGVSLMLMFVFFSRALGIDLGLWSVLIAHVTFCLPYVILNVLPKLRQMDPFLPEAAMDLGCNPTSAFFKVVLPEIAPGILSGFLMSFTFSLDDFIITYFASGSAFPTLPTTIYSMTRMKVNPQINALSTLMFVAVLLLLVLMNLKNSRKKRAEGGKYR